MALLATVAAVGVGVLLPAVGNPPAGVGFVSRFAVAKRLDVLAKWQAFVEDGALTLQVGIVVATARK